MRSKEPSSYDHQILTSDSDTSSYTLYNEQPNVRENHSTLVSSGYQEPVDNIEGNNVTVTDRRHSEPTLANYTIPSSVRCIDTLSYTEPADAIHSRPHKPIPVVSVKPSSSKQPKKPMFPPMYTSLVSNTREPRNLYMATSNPPQRGSAPPFSTSENDELYTLPRNTAGRFTDQRRPGLGPVRNVPPHQTTQPTRVTQQPNPPSQAGQSTDNDYYCYPDDNTGEDYSYLADAKQGSRGNQRPAGAGNTNTLSNPLYLQVKRQ